MQIKELALKTGVSAKTIRYYESIRLLPEPQRLDNNYRLYSEEDVQRVKLVAGATRLGLALDEVTEVLALRDRGEAPCRTLLDLLAQKAEEIHSRIEGLRRLEQDLRELYALGITFPIDDVNGKNCVCHLVSERSRESGKR